MAAPRETEFTSLDGVPVHYDRDPGSYGTKGRPYVFKCTHQLRTTLDGCFAELFGLIPGGKPELITSAGTIGDGDNAHGRGLAFDLDGLFWNDKSLIFDDFFSNKYVYIGINSHLYLYFSQVLNYYYPKHDDHFHMDFNFAYQYSSTSNAQTFFLQACLKYVFDEELGRHGAHHDGVDGVYGDATGAALENVLKGLNLNGKGGLEKKDVWFDFLKRARAAAFARISFDVPATMGAFRPFSTGKIAKIQDDVWAAITSVVNNYGDDLFSTKINEIYIGTSGQNDWMMDARIIKTKLQLKYKALSYDDKFSVVYFKKSFGDFLNGVTAKIVKSEK